MSLLSIDTLFSPELAKILCGDKIPFGVGFSKKTPKKYGVEIDLRSENKKIYLHHDPFKKGTLFSEWLKYYNHKLIVLNVKEEGLEKHIIKLFNLWLT